MATPIIDTTFARGSATHVGTRSPMTASTSGPSARVRMTLERLWRDVDQQFFEQTGRHLASSGLYHKAGVMEAWQRKYENDDNSETARKHKHIADVIQTVLDGVEVIGAFAAQAASTVFAPAGVCFNAMAFLIDAPKQIRKVYDGLRDLFEEVSDFLVKFRILKRIDDEQSLDEDLIMNTNKILMSFVRICILSIHLLEASRFRVAAKAIFLKDDSSVSAELEVFRRLTQSSSMLTGTVTLEHVMRSEQDVKSILASSSEMNAKITSLAAASSDERTKLVNKERLAVIERKLFARGGPPSIETTSPRQVEIDLLPETLGLLNATTEWRDWTDRAVVDTRIIGIAGASGTGKSLLVEFLKDKLDNDRRDMPKDGPSIYVCYHNFRSQEKSVSKLLPTQPIDLALRSIAFQVASQSTTYARKLERHLQQHNNIHDLGLKALWSSLGLCGFSPPLDSTMFVLLDSVEQEENSTIRALLENLLGGRDRSDSNSFPNVRIRVLLAATKMPHIGRPIPTLDLQALNMNLIQTFITKELQRLNIFQGHDRRSKDHKLVVQENLPLYSAGRFDVVRRKLEMIREAINEDTPVGELSEILEAQVELDSDEETQQVLGRLESSLRPQHIQQLNSLLMWTVYNQRKGEDFEIDELEAALYMSNGDHTLEPLLTKINGRFKDIFRLVGGQGVRVREPILDILKKDEHVPYQPPSLNTPLFSLCISLQNATEKDIRRFVWDLNEEMVAGKFEFSKPQNSVRKPTIKINEVEAQLQVTKSCLKLLNEGPQDAAQALMYYARDYLPLHLVELHSLCNRISITDRTSISQGLIQYLSDPYYVEHECNDFGTGLLWLVESHIFDSIRFWLEDPAVVIELPAREKRWVQKAKESKGQTWFMKDVATAVARKWSEWNQPEWNWRMQPWYLYNWLEFYIKSNKTNPVDTPVSGGSPEVENMELEGNTTTTRSSGSEQTTLQRVTEVVDFVQARLKDQTEIQRSMMMAQMLHFYKGYAEAAKFYANCSADPDYQCSALMDLGLCKSHLGEEEAARSSFAEAVSIIRKRKDLGQLSIDDIEQYTLIFRQLADGYDFAGQHDQVLQLWQEILAENEWDNRRQWDLVTALSLVGRDAQLATLLRDWTMVPDKHGGRSPAQSLVEWLEGGQNLRSLESLVARMHGQDIVSCMTKTLEEAVTIASAQQNWSHSPLLFNLALANIIRSGNANCQQAITSWELMMQNPPPADPEYLREWVLVTDAAYVCLGRCKFDEVREKARTQTSLSSAEVEEIVDEVRSYIQFTVLPSNDISYQFTYKLSSPNAYVAGVYTVLGRQDLARKYLCIEMADCLVIMSDDEPDNDSPALRRMFTIFRLTNDLTDAMSAWCSLSIYDRELVSNGTYGDRGCRSCKAEWDYMDQHGIWLCKFCIELQFFCQSCYTKKVVERTEEWRMYDCNPDHEFMNLHSGKWMHKQEEQGKVKVDFELRTDEHGNQVYAGGQVVDVSEWMERIRVEWDLSLITSRMRAQK